MQAAAHPHVSSPYERIGGDVAIRRLVDRFYELMDELPEAYAARKIHPADLTESGNKLFDFLSGWLGGPPLYQQKIGQPFLRARHLPFSIGAAERDLWLACMRQALRDVGVEERLGEALANAFHKTADHMRNRPEG